MHVTFKDRPQGSRKKPALGTQGRGHLAASSAGLDLIEGHGRLTMAEGEGEKEGRGGGRERRGWGGRNPRCPSQDPS